MKKFIIALTVVGSMFIASQAMAQQRVIIYHPSWTPVEYNQSVQYEWRRSWLFPRWYKLKRRVVLTPVTPQVPQQQSVQ